MLGAAEILAVLVENDGGNDERSDKCKACGVLVEGKVCVRNSELSKRKKNSQDKKGEGKDGLGNRAYLRSLNYEDICGCKVWRIYSGIITKLAAYGQESTPSKSAHGDDPEQKEDGVNDYDG